MSRRANIQRLIQNYSRRLQKLREQESLYGLSTPPAILLEIEDIETKLEYLGLELQALDKPDGEDSTGHDFLRNDIEQELITLEKDPKRSDTGIQISVLALTIGAVAIIFPALALIFNTTVIGHQAASGGTITAASSAQSTSTPLLAPTLTPAPTPTLLPLPDGFNIGVAQFARLDDISDENSQQLSQWLFDTVVRNIQNNFSEEISLHVRGPAEIGPIVGKDEQSWAEHAATLAKRHNLKILIYGVMGRGQSSIYLEPSFFVPYDQKRFDYVRELGGSTRFGARLPLDLPLTDSTLLTTNRILLNRAQALSHILLGLSDFFLRRYVEANEDFGRALTVSSEADPAGQEVIYLLLGAAHVRTTDQYLPGTANWQAGFLQAQQAFSQALTLKPEYARAHLGLGTVWLNRAKSFTDTGLITSVDAVLLQTAVDEYKSALMAADRPFLAHVPEKAYYQLGQTYQLGYEFFGPQIWPPAKAQDYYSRVINAFDPDHTPELNWLVGNAYVSSCQLEALVAGQPNQPPPNWAEVEAKCRTGLNILESMTDSNVPSPLAEYRLILGYTIAQQPGRKAEGCRLYDQAIIEAAGQQNLPPDWAESVRQLKRDLNCE